jgi:hypothetical protein
MITFGCPHCGFVIKVDSRLVGKKGKCAHCARPITVPSLETVAASALAPATNGANGTHAAQTSSPAVAQRPVAAAQELVATTVDALAQTVVAPASANGHHAGASITPAAELANGKRFEHVQVPARDADVEKMLSDVAVDAQAAADSVAKAIAGAPKNFVANLFPQSAVFERSTAAQITSIAGVLGVLFFALLFDVTADASLGHANTWSDVKLTGIIVSTGLALLGRFPNRIRFEKKV